MILAQQKVALSWLRGVFNSVIVELLETLPEPSTPQHLRYSNIWKIGLKKPIGKADQFENQPNSQCTGYNLNLSLVA